MSAAPIAADPAPTLRASETYPGGRRHWLPALVGLVAFAMYRTRGRSVIAFGDPVGNPAHPVDPAAGVPGIMDELREVSDAWLAAKRVREKGFSTGAFEPACLARFDVATVRVGTRIVAFANLWPAGDRSELSIDLMRHREDAPNGIMDCLFVELILWGKAQGSGTFGLGMAPLAGLEHRPLATLWNRVGNLVFRLGDEFHNFDGLRNYKRKFKPEWEPRYLAAPGGLALPRVLLDATTLISGGVKGVFAR